MNDTQANEEGQTHTPIRTCVGCRQKGPQATMVRVVLDPAGRLKVDRAGPGRRGKQKGRGAYLHEIRACVEEAVHNSAFPRSFRRAAQRVDVDALWTALTTPTPEARESGSSDE